MSGPPQEQPWTEASDPIVDNSAEVLPDAPLTSDVPEVPPLPKRKGGRKPIYSTIEERKQRNRQAQAAFRERRTEYIKQLEITLKENEQTIQDLEKDSRKAFDECHMLRYKTTLLEELLREHGIAFEEELENRSKRSLTGREKAYGTGDATSPVEPHLVQDTARNSLRHSLKSRQGRVFRPNTKVQTSGLQSVIHPNTRSPPSVTSPSQFTFPALSPHVESPFERDNFDMGAQLPYPRTLDTSHGMTSDFSSATSFPMKRSSLPNGALNGSFPQSHLRHLSTGWMGPGSYYAAFPQQHTNHLGPEQYPHNHLPPTRHASISGHTESPHSCCPPTTRPPTSARDTVDDMRYNNRSWFHQQSPTEDIPPFYDHSDEELSQFDDTGPASDLAEHYSFSALSTYDSRSIR